MQRKQRIAVLVASFFALTSCAITTAVKPVKDGNVGLVCVKQNDAIYSKEFGQGVVSLLEEKGIKATLYFSNDMPTTCSHRLEYTADWKWDMAMYLNTAKLNVYRGDELAGEALYDARQGAGSMKKFGSTAGKISPLLDQLFPGAGKSRN
jgi:hypothetical protein